MTFQVHEGHTYNASWMQWVVLPWTEQPTSSCWLDDVIKWKHFQRYWTFVLGIHRSSVNSSHKSQWRGAFSLICAWINAWVNDREAGDLRRHRAHPWWRHQMETFFSLLAICAGNSPVPGEVPTQRPVTRSFYVFFDLRPNKRLSKQSWGWWFETLSRPLWRHRNA